MFILGGYSDPDMGGFVMGSVIENLRICLPHKVSKVSRYVARYPEWWLVLEDRVGWGSFDRANGLQDVADAFPDLGPFSRVVLFGQRGNLDLSAGR